MRFIIFALLAVVAVSAQNAVPNKSCTPNVPFKKYCNSCKCNAEGKPAGCTKMICPPGLYNEDGSINYDVENSFDVTYSDVSDDDETPTLKEKRQPGQFCEPRKSFKKFCNDCRCNDAGTAAACTKALCPEGLYNEDGTLNVETVEILRDKREHDAPRICEPGKTFKKYCNNCRCNSDGTSAACTKALCPEGLYNKDGSVNY